MKKELKLFLERFKTKQEAEDYVKALESTYHFALFKSSIEKGEHPEDDGYYVWIKEDENLYIFEGYLIRENLFFKEVVWAFSHRFYKDNFGKEISFY